jgi:hypothetical protein
MGRSCEQGQTSGEDERKMEQSCVHDHARGDTERKFGRSCVQGQNVRAKQGEMGGGCQEGKHVLKDIGYMEGEMGRLYIPGEDANSRTHSKKDCLAFHPYLPLKRLKPVLRIQSSKQRKFTFAVLDLRLAMYVVRGQHTGKRADDASELLLVSRKDDIDVLGEENVEH